MQAGPDLPGLPRLRRAVRLRAAAFTRPPVVLCEPFDLLNPVTIDFGTFLQVPPPGLLQLLRPPMENPYCSCWADRGLQLLRTL